MPAGPALSMACSARAASPSTWCSAVSPWRWWWCARPRCCLPRSWSSSTAPWPYTSSHVPQPVTFPRQAVQWELGFTVTAPPHSLALSAGPLTWPCQRCTMVTIARAARTVAERASALRHRAAGNTPYQSKLAFTQTHAQAAPALAPAWATHIHGIRHRTRQKGQGVGYPLPRVTRCIVLVHSSRRFVTARTALRSRALNFFGA